MNGSDTYGFECTYCGKKDEGFDTRARRDEEIRLHVENHCQSHPMRRIERRAKDLCEELAAVRKSRDFWREKFQFAEADSKFSLAVPAEWMKTLDSPVTTESPSTAVPKPAAKKQRARK